MLLHTCSHTFKEHGMSTSAVGNSTCYFNTSQRQSLPSGMNLLCNMGSSCSIPNCIPQAWSGKANSIMYLLFFSLNGCFVSRLGEDGDHGRHALHWRRKKHNKSADAVIHRLLSQFMGNYKSTLPLLWKSQTPFRRELGWGSRNVLLILLR